VPCNGGVLSPAVALTADGVLDVDVPSVLVEGMVTVNGAAMEQIARMRGAISFVRGTGARQSSFAVPLPSSGEARYRATLLPGTYDIVFDGAGELCAMMAPPSIPCDRAVILPARALTQDGVLDLDLPTVRISGRVTLNGALYPRRSDDDAAIVFQTLDGGSTSTVSTQRLGSLATADYTAVLLKGKKVVTFADDRASCGGASLVPCINQVLAGCP
jgi:hypothetical protein